MSFVNICRDNTDPFYRYKMPLIQSKVEGRGNGIKTAIVNLDEVARALARPPSYVVKYFGYELGAQTTDKGGRYIVNGAHEASELQDCLDGFISKFVLCPSCKNPETEIQIKEKGVLQRDCKACGHISYLDPRHKLISFILKTVGTGKKGKKAATASAIASGQSITEIAANHTTSSSNAATDAAITENDDDDVLTKKIKAEAAALKQQEIEVADDDWAVDMSKEAIEARARELEGLSLGAENPEHARFNEFGEWLLQEGGEDKEELPSDIEIYKKIVELEISGQPETVQVLAQVLFNEDLIEQIDEHLGLLAKLINHDPENEKAFLGGLERYLGLENQDLIPALPKILMSVYDKDLISEEVIIEWGSKVSKKYVPKDVSKKVRKAAKSFVKWLQEADEESEDED
ncbi:eukaryotic translation initiation factor 5 [[Candida] railenensis]|uniref:Eukaryotic translation initiation factor 5 n=1 Tax=[Candida] railenensis TaxID=45579 RepID=A0A9P0QVK9_9ASCO|nr:eukaryotic translation initiation factor 5 [[Candida] railenensis]